VQGKHRETDADDPQRRRFMTFARPLARVAMQTPEERRAGGHFNRAVESEADERNAAGQESRSERNQLTQCRGPLRRERDMVFFCRNFGPRGPSVARRTSTDAN
jgi:hypothetical protein